MAASLARVLPVLIDAALEGAVVFLLVALATPFLRRRSAAVRHAAWSFAVGVQLALLPLARVAPSWGVPLVDAPRVVTIALGAETPRRREALGTAGDARRDEIARPADGRRVGAERVLRAAATVWLAGAALVLVPLAIGTIGVWRLAARGRRVLEPAWLALAHELAARLGISRPLTLLRGDSLAVPVTWGIVYPVVLLPADAESWDDEQRRYVLVHEMAHVRRVDALTHLLGQLTLAVFWFSPFVWLALSRMRVAREQACDDYVLRTGMTPSRYADDLLTMIRSIGRPNRRATGPAFAALAMARRSEFEGRMLAILEDDAPREPLSRGGAVSGAIVAGGAALVLAGFTPLATRPVPAHDSTVLVTPAQPVSRPDSATAPRIARTSLASAQRPLRPRPSRAPSRDASLDSALASMRPDNTKTAIAAQYASSGDEARVAAALRAVPSLADDRQRSLVLAQAAANGRPSPARTAEVLRASARLRTPGTASLVLMHVAQHRLVTSESLRALYLRAVDTLVSDDDRQQALTALLLATPARLPATP